MSDRPTILLVHGAWHGAWCWEPLQEILEKRGWSTVAIDLPTVSASDPTGLAMHDDAAAVADAIDAIDGDVVVVAHSYGGVPVTQGALSPSVRRIVYVAAFVLDVGESLLASLGGEQPDWWVVDGERAMAGTEQRPAQQLFFGDVDRSLADASAERLLPQNMAAFTEPLTAAAWRDHPTTYVLAEQDAIFPVPAQEALAARAGASIVRLSTSHSPFLSQPEAVADVIETAARQN